MNCFLKYLAAAFACVLPLSALAQSFSVAGVVTDKSTGEPVEYATIVIEATEQWAVADGKGRFSISNIGVNKTVISVSCLGYVTDSREVVLRRDISNYSIALRPDDLTLDNAVVTARQNDNSAATSRTIDKAALEHVQLMNVSDISGLLPGGVTASNDLTSGKQFDIRGGGTSESGNSSFGTAVEVDGVRLSNNASYAEASTNLSVKGVTTNNIASANVESVEVITGVPSVEYGDMSSGVVKINTKKGKTPWMLTMSTSPVTKQVSASKGFGLGESASGASRGVLNAGIEHTRSISEPMSPYTAYGRNSLSVSWFNLLNRGIFAEMPLRISAGISGNIGGLDTSADPDAVQGTWSVSRDNAVRANLSLNWLLSRPWITNLEFTATSAYSDKLVRDNQYYSSAINKTVLHGRGQGYFIAMPYSGGDASPVMYIPAGYWFNEMYDDDRPLAAKASLKATWARKFGALNNKLKLGGDWSMDTNFGTGQGSADMATAPTFREYRYCDNPAMHNAGFYIEDNLLIPAGKEGRVNLIAGLRNDNTMVKGSAYGLTSSLSPRLNAKYTVMQAKDRHSRTLRELSFRGGWGLAVKLPSFSVLFPMPTYLDVNVFTSTTNAANESFAAYFIRPRTVEYNPDLRWQRNRLAEIGVDADVKGTKISLVAFWNRTLDAYRLNCDYERTTYSYTPDSVLSGVSIPADRRSFSIDAATGIVSVRDKAGLLPDEVLPHQEYKELTAKYTPSNESSPIDRYGLEWVVDFAPIKAVNTSVRIDGTYYAYRSLSSDILAWSPSSYRSAQDGLPFRYVGYYYGGNSISNGSRTQTLRNNVTFITRLPQVRMIFTVKLEGTFLRYSRDLCEDAAGNELAHVISDRSDILSTTGESIYAGENMAVRYPEYYCSFDDPTPRNYLEDLIAAKERGDMALYSDLVQLSVRSSRAYVYSKDYISPYFCANFSVTKEIGELASLSFYANNFFNNRSQVYSTRTRSWESLYPRFMGKFNYGLTLRLKF